MFRLCPSTQPAPSNVTLSLVRPIIYRGLNSNGPGHIESDGLPRSRDQTENQTPSLVAVGWNVFGRNWSKCGLDYLCKLNYLGCQLEPVLRWSAAISRGGGVGIGDVLR
jgi:hypothetical protein